MEQWLSYYHPSTVVFVDDQQAFLSVIKNRLPKEMMALFFNNPIEALEKIKQAHLSMSDDSYPLCEVDDNLELDVNTNDARFNLKLSQLANIAHNIRRFSEISVVIVDRMMPGLDGINFCRQLKNYPIKKIMLTGSKDRTIAIEAFNEGIIDFFLVKDTPNLSNQLITAIGNMQNNYFASLSKRMLGNTVEMAVPLLKNPLIIQFLKAKIVELNVVEYYLFDKGGSILFITFEGVVTILAISSDKTIDHYAAIANEHDEPVIAKVLHKKEKLLFFPQESDSMRPVHEWGHFLFDAILIPGQTNLFYSLIGESIHHPIAPKKVYSQGKYIFDMNHIKKLDAHS
jgi:CheY-like chemotaxis protein